MISHLLGSAITYVKITGSFIHYGAVFVVIPPTRRVPTLLIAHSTGLFNPVRMVTAHEVIWD
ncbi:hypothetical protein N7451_005465 [Penicillium sp. IBT 35674x]|nr:hypothetical protein N7451_005465 [Penicillium sp. IBT 35674x]